MLLLLLLYCGEGSLEHLHTLVDKNVSQLMFISSVLLGETDSIIHSIFYSDDFTSLVIILSLCNLTGDTLHLGNSFVM